MFMTKNDGLQLLECVDDFVIHLKQHIFETLFQHYFNYIFYTDCN